VTPSQETPPPNFSAFRRLVAVRTITAVLLFVAGFLWIEHGLLRTALVILVVGVLPSFDEIKLAMKGSEADYNQLYEAVAAGLRTRPPEKTSADAVREWSIITKVVLVVFSGGGSLMMFGFVAMVIHENLPLGTLAVMLFSATIFGGFAFYVLWHSFPRLHRRVGRRRKQV
jgi:hypothetical protein